jgi:dUTP pyrophosphatase
MDIKIKRFDKSVRLPTYEKKAAGFDFFCRIGTTIKPGEVKPVPSNIAMEIPDGYVLLIIPRSSTPFRLGISMPNSLGVIDPFYFGDDNEIMLIFYNFTNKPVTIKKGERLAQGILVKYEQLNFKEVDSLKKSARKKWSVDHKRNVSREK